MRFLLKLLLLPVVLLAIDAVSAGGVEEPALPPRVGNDTLRLPERIPLVGYGLVNAFPGVTFEQPVALAAPPEDTNRLFVVERTGKIYVVTNLAQPTKTLFLDLSPRVESRYLETGLLGLTFHPGFSSNRFCFVFRTMYTSTPGAQNRLHEVVSRFEASTTNPELALTNSEVTILAQLDDSDQHNGGDLKFGPDGYLYVSMGERVHRDIHGPDQTPVDRDLQGAILRLDVDGRPGNLPPNPHPASTDHYWIPADNPFVGVTQHHGLAVNPSEVRTELYAIGLRNPWRMAFDQVTGDLYVGDVGEGAQEEVDLVVPGGDYGWPYFEGLVASGFARPPRFNPLPPLHTYGHGWSGGTNGDCVVGGVVYGGNAIPSLRGSFLFADFNSGYLWSLERHGPTPTVERLLGTSPGLAAFAIDPRDGEVLAAHLFDGTILRLVYMPPEAVTNLPPTLEETGIFEDLAALKPNGGIVPYEVNLPFWSDQAEKQRWFSLPDTNQTIGFNPTGLWTFPTGAVWVKHFELALTNGQAASRRRLETRVLVNGADGFYGLTYRWGDSTTNAWLVPEQGETERFTIRDASGAILREQEWRYPSRAECMNCHTRISGRVLGFNTAQLNRAALVGTVTTNQLLALAAAGYLDPAPPVAAEWPALATASDPDAPVEFRVRSYFQANCSFCHAPGADTLAAWDARITTPLAQAGIVSSGGVVQPGRPQDSRLYQHLLGFPFLMPPIATTVHNTDAVALVANWITSLPPAPWSYGTIGDVLQDGGSTCSNGVYRVSGTGLGLQSTQDGFQFMRRPFDQPAAQFIARLISQSASADSAFAGLMVREGAGPSDRFVMAACRADGMALSLRRAETNTATVSDLAAPAATPQWLRLVRLGNDLSAFRSEDGTNWVALGVVNWEVSGALQVGFAVNSGSRTAFNNATFDDASYLSIALSNSTSAPLAQPANVTLQSSVERSGRELARIEFYDNDEKIGQATSAPYAMTLSNLWSGDHEFRARAVDETGTVVVSQPIHVQVQPRASLVAMTSEEEIDGGDWHGHYGAAGYSIASYEMNLPAFADVALTGATTEIWADDTEDERGLVKDGTGRRIAATWEAADSFTVSVKVRDGQLHRLSLYFVDWDTTDARVQLVEFIDPATGSVLLSRTLSDFSRGVYLVSTIRGNVEVRLRHVAGPSVVLSAVFLEEAMRASFDVAVASPVEGQSMALPTDLVLAIDLSALDHGIERVEYYLDDELAGVAEQSPFRVTLTNLLAGAHVAVARAFDSLGEFGDSIPVTFQGVLPQAKAVFVREDGTTRGNWSQRYGTEGFLLLPLTNWWPTRNLYDVGGASTWVQEFGANANYLELPNQIARAFSFLYSYSDIIYDLDLADGRPGKVALYFFDDAIYPQRVSALDSATGQTLDTRTVTNGLGGRYLVWNIQGHVRLRVSNPTVGDQARVNGLFLDPFTNAPPEVTLLQPAGDLEVMTPAKVRLAATATAPDGVGRVEFHTATAKLGEVLSPPYEFLWEYPAAGSHQVFARAVSVDGAATDSQEATILVSFATPAEARFVRSDPETGGDWKGVYGTEGYWLPSSINYSNLPPTMSITNRQTWTDYGNGSESRALARPDALTRILSFWTGPDHWQLPLRLNDGRAHRVSFYNYAPGRADPLTITIRPAGSETVLDVREIPRQDSGTYLTWRLQGDLTIQLSAPASSAFLNGIFVDPAPSAYDEWEQAHFTPAEQANSGISGEMADPDADAYSNWAEYLLGRDPRALDPEAPLWFTREAGGVFLHVLVRETATDDDVRVQASADLQTWNEARDIQPKEARDRGERIERLYQVLPDREEGLFFRLWIRPP